MSSTIDNRIPPADAETSRMIREEVLLRPARRAAIFCLLVLATLLVMSKTAAAATFSSGAPISIVDKRHLTSTLNEVMGDPNDVRAQRLAENEALFRLANERMANWQEQHADEATELYFCECANTDCRQKVELRKADYERARSESRQFVIAPGHEMPEVETVLERHQGWELISKDDRVLETVEALDPRSDV